MMDLLFSAAGLGAIVTVICAGAIQGSTGFGFNMLAAPLLAIIDPGFVPGAMLIMATVICIGGAIQERHAVARADLGFALLGRLIAAVLAATLIGMFSPRIFSAFFGLAVLLAVVLSLSGLRITPSPSRLFGAGLVSGFMGTLTSIGAPPMALVYQNAEPARMRATLNAYFFVGGIISVAALAGAGRIGAVDFQLAALLLPFAFAGFLLSGVGRRLMGKGRVRPVVLAVSSASAVVLLLRAFS